MVAATHTKLKKYWTVRTFERFLNTRKTAIRFLQTKLIKNGHCYKIYSNFKVVSHFKKIYFREEKNNSYRVIPLFINYWGFQRFLPTTKTGQHILLVHRRIFISVVLRVILMMFRIGCSFDKIRRHMFVGDWTELVLFIWDWMWDFCVLGYDI